MKKTLLICIMAVLVAMFVFVITACDGVTITTDQESGDIKVISVDKGQADDSIKDKTEELQGSTDQENSVSGQEPAAQSQETEHEHSFCDWYIDLPATCMREGEKNRTCACGKIEIEKIPIVDHEYSDWRNSAIATCTTYGKKYRRCNWCGNVEEIISSPALGHDLIIHQAKNPTCTEFGWESYETCSRCSYSSRYFELPALGHDYLTTVTAATCLSQGYTTYTCKRCDHSYIGNYLPQKRHVETVDAYIPATCSNTGLTEGSHCSECGLVLVPQRTIEKDENNHIFSDWVIAQSPNCTQNGVRYRNCSECGKAEAENVPAIGHQGDWIILQQATCLHEGNKELHCTACNNLIRDVIEVADHKWGDWSIIKEASCGIGYRTRTCSTCERTKKEIMESDKSKSHSFNETNVCEVCGEHRATEGLKYEIGEYGRLCVVDYEGTDQDVYIPFSYAGMPVSQISTNAFAGHSEIRSISIPESVIKIAQRAFYGCTGLTSIVFPDSVREIGRACLEDCFSLKEVILPFVGINADHAMEHTSSSSGWQNNFCAVFGHGYVKARYRQVRQYDDELFAVPPGLNKVTITGGTIGGSAFYGCDFLDSIILGDWISETIGSYAFYRCLAPIKIPNGIKHIGMSAFAGCKGLTELLLPNSVESIGISAFGECTNLTTVFIPDSVNSIGAFAFNGCSNLTSVYIPDSVKTIGSSVFSRCCSIVSLDLPFLKGRIGLFGELFSENAADGDKVFAVSQDIDGISNTNVTYYRYYIPSSIISVSIRNGNIDRGAFYNCSMLLSIILGNGVNSIGESAFKNCTSLASISIGSEVESIGDFAFEGCEGLTIITYQGTKEEWNTIQKGEKWDEATGAYVIHCTDGNIDKE